MRDLAVESSPSTERVTDVCIIGTGPAGLTLARALAEKGLAVTLLERGGHEADIATPAAGVAFDRLEFRGATLGRAFGLGGTSNLWGGQLLPVLPHDITARPHAGVPPWPIRHAELQPWFAQLEQWLGVDALPFDLSLATRLGHPLAALDWSGFSPRFSKWIPFGRRNLARAWGDLPSWNARVETWINAEAFEFAVRPGDVGPNIVQVTARATNGKRLQVTPRAIVVAAGALESARLALEMRAQGAVSDGSAHDALGRFLHDHLSVRVAKVAIRNRRRFVELFAPFFSGATMRSPRLEIAPEVAASRGLPALYAHFVAHASESSGFAVVRDTLRAAQRGQLLRALGTAGRAAPALPGIAEIAFWRYARGRLVFPSDAEVFVHIDFEQRAVRQNRVYIDGAGTGRPAPLRIDWDLDVDPARIARPMREMLLDFWARNQLDKVAKLEFLTDDALRNGWPTNLYDIYHPAGTTRMARTEDEGAVAPDLRLFGSENVYVLSTSVFPSMGAANPTFTLMALALRLAGFLGAALSSRAGSATESSSAA